MKKNGMVVQWQDTAAFKVVWHIVNHTQHYVFENDNAETAVRFRTIPTLVHCKTK